MMNPPLLPAILSGQGRRVGKVAVKAAVPATSSAPVAQGVMVANPAITSIASPSCRPVASVDFARSIIARRRSAELDNFLWHVIRLVGSFFIIA